MQFIVHYGSPKTSVEQVNSTIKLNLATPYLDGLCDEVIYNNGNSQQSSDKNFTFFSNDAHIIGLATTPVKDEELETVTESFYHELLKATAGYRLARIWNYIPDINKSSNGIENYRQFCKGRAQAFDHYPEHYKNGYPAASAVGTNDSQLTVYFIAYKQDVTLSENPFQQPAYTYPEDYGPRSPSFSRACTVPMDLPDVYISGTAAVLGHKSVGYGNIEQQLKTTCSNLKAILSEASGKPLEHNNLYLKTYLRNPELKDMTLQYLIDALEIDPSKITIIQSDICREELDVEVEISIRNSVLNPQVL